MEMVAEAMISCGSIGIAKNKLYNRMAEYLQKRIVYFENQNLVCRIFDALSLVNVPQYGLYNQVVTLAECIPNWLHLKHLISIARSGVKVGIVDDRIFRCIVFKAKDIPECTAEELVPVVKLSHNFASSLARDEDGLKRWYKFLFTILESLDERSSVDIENLMELLEGLVTIQVKTAQIEQLSARILQGAEDVNICKITALFGILGKVESEALFGTLERIIDESIQSLDGNQCSCLIWDMIAIGFPYNSLVLSKVVQRFNQLKPKNNEHLLSIISTMIKFNARGNPGEMLGKHWREFLKITQDYKDVSWHRESEDVEIIKGVARGIQGAQTFVREFPYTVDISIPVEELGGFSGGGRHASGTFGVVIPVEGQAGALEEALDTGPSPQELRSSPYSAPADSHSNAPVESSSYDPLGCVERKSEGAKEGQKIALFFYRRDQNPFVITIRPDGSHERRFNFYNQTR
ncbi:hypothetical protein BEWA_038610 [Theileria equi strain WA]|uniref:Uncharacterized protein n=1 Tax=Theileria equi strain WA TaxID=1537102 RepID=L1LFA0_THEEQ|nr:hypothetical protein BEWA_038610 [Theileria equi strain WA]EKX73823.1 hypothetical protein BEWA_038610 [Theileria equi strain WA]|eukprot:XP_004833275.1 hypothetical protein BEWA_038610 [Theileria equi strain WA]